MYVVHVMHLVCAYLCMSISTDACMFVFLYLCMHVCIYVCMYVCMYVCTYPWHVCRYACVYVCLCVCMHACVCANVHECRHFCMRVFDVLSKEVGKQYFRITGFPTWWRLVYDLHYTWWREVCHFTSNNNRLQSRTVWDFTSDINRLQ